MQDLCIAIVMSSERHVEMLIDCVADMEHLRTASMKSGFAYVAAVSSCALYCLNGSLA